MISEREEGLLQAYDAHQKQISELRERLHAVLEHAAVEIRPCRRCGEMLYFVRGKESLVPFTTEGIDHSTTHVKKRAATQEALFDAAPLPE